MPVTEHYLLAFFDFGEDLSSPLNVQKERDRFVVIDKQLYAMYSVFGDGVVGGWTVNDGTGLTVTIDPGVGIIKSMAVESSFADLISDLPPNQTIGVYAYIDNSTILNREATFGASSVPLSNGLLLANVTTGGTGVESIDNTVRNSVGFSAIIEAQIAQHRHNGISAPKIDLTSETQGLLPNDRMEDLDAGKVTTGKLPKKVLPTIDHQDLKNIGRYTHAGLDSLAQNIQREDLQRFMEIVTANHLKDVLFQKYKDADVDQYFLNELAIIPGITPDAFIDWDATTAAVDKTNHCISGIPAFETGLGGTPISFADLELLTISYTTDADFKQARVLTNVEVNEGVRLSADAVFNRVIDDFEGGRTANAIPGATITTYTSEVVEDTSSKVKFDSNPYDGNLAGRFETDHTRYSVFTRTLDRAQDWSPYDKLVLAVKNYGATHSAVYLSVMDSDGNEIGNYKVLEEDEVTTLANPLTNGYQLIEIDISGWTRSTVKSYKFYTTDILNGTEIFFVDSIYLKNQNILLPQGNVRFRYNTSSAVIFNSVEYEATIPSGTDLRVRVRIADTLEGLATATFTPILSSGEVFGLNGSYIEIDITFVSDSNRINTPELTAVFLTMLVPSDESGLVIQSASSWSKGITQNITVEEDGLIELTNTNVGDIYFTTSNIVNELNPDLNPVAGINGNNIPISPEQGFLSITEQSEFRGLKRPKSAVRLISGNYLICDTGNDRVLEITEDGTFVRGFASHNLTLSDSQFVCATNYNPRLGVLFIAFSKTIDITNFDLTTITLYYDNFKKSITLNNQTDKVKTLTGTIVDRSAVATGTTASTSITEKTLAVYLDVNKVNELAEVETPLFMKVVNGINLQPIDVFYGDFMYFGEQGVYRPVHAFQVADREWVILNSRISHDFETVSTSVSLIRFDTKVGEVNQGQIIGLTFQYNDVDFSDIVLGSAKDIGDDKLLVCGLNKLPTASPTTGTTTTTTTSTTTTTTSITTTTPTGTATTTSDPTTTTTTTTNNETPPDHKSDPQKLEGYSGTVIILDTKKGLISFRYLSPDGLYPSDAILDDDGFVTVAESSLNPQSGRIVKLDPFGNIIWITEGGMFTKVNDVRLVENDHLFVST